MTKERSWQNDDLLAQTVRVKECRSTKRIEAGKAAALGLAIFVILWLRRPDCLLNAQFWAEDGGLFFREQVLYGFWGSLARSYAGYLHVIPRMVTAAICVLLPVRWVPLGCNACALLLEAVSCSAFFWPCYRKIIASDSLRAVCCLAMTASVVAGSELIATLSNVQWYLCILSLLLIVDAPRVREIWLTVAQAAVALSAPVTLLYLPFLVWQLRTKARWPRLRPAIHIGALLLQVWVMSQSTLEPKPVLRLNSLFLATLSSGLSRCVLAPLFGSAFLQEDTEISLLTKMAVAGILGVALATLLAVRLRGLRRLHWLASGAYVGTGSLVAILGGRGVAKSFLSLSGLRTYTAERYFFVGACLFVFCVALAMDTFADRWKPGMAAALLAGAFAWGTLQNFSARPFADLDWKTNAGKIERWDMARKRHEKVETLTIPINPPNLVLVLDGSH